MEILESDEKPPSEPSGWVIRRTDGQRGFRLQITSRPIEINRKYNTKQANRGQTLEEVTGTITLGNAGRLGYRKRLLRPPGGAG